MTCFICGKKVYKHNQHHIKPRSEGGSDERRNLLPVCPRCHNLIEELGWEAIFRLKKSIGNEKKFNRIKKIPKKYLRPKPTPFKKPVLKIVQKVYQPKIFESRLCLTCNLNFTPKNKNQIYCSEICSKSFYKNSYLYIKKKLEPIECDWLNCNVLFTPKRKDQRFCCPECKKEFLKLAYRVGVNELDFLNRLKEETK